MAESQVVQADATNMATLCTGPQQAVTLQNTSNPDCDGFLELSGIRRSLALIHDELAVETRIGHSHAQKLQSTVGQTVMHTAYQ